METQCCCAGHSLDVGEAVDAPFPFGADDDLQRHSRVGGAGEIRVKRQAAAKADDLLQGSGLAHIGQPLGGHRGFRRTVRQSGKLFERPQTQGAVFRLRPL
jgi:hypothetical protein